MTTFKLLQARGRTVFGALMIGGLGACHCSAEPPADASTATNSVAANVSVTNAVPPAAKPQLTGAELYSIHCNRCHAERYPTERTAANWKTIMLHMQVRANIPGKQARLILQYLQENSGR